MTTMNWTLVGDVGGAATYHVGDEAMMQANLDLFRAIAPQARLTIVSGDPAYSASVFGVDAVPRLGFDRCTNDDERESLLAALSSETTSSNPEAFDRLRTHSDGLVISGGGNLTSFWPNFIYERVAFCRQAARVGAPIVVLGQTVGPWLAPRHRELVEEMMGLALWVGVREAPSFALALELGAPMERLSYQLDDAAALGVGMAATQVPFDAELPWMAITFHPIADPLSDDPAWDRLATQLHKLSAQTGCRMVFVPHAKAAPALGAPWSDEDVAHALGRRFPPGTLVELPVLPAREVAALTARASMIVSSRYHPIVFGLASSVPCLGVWADEYTRVKLHGALSHYGCGQDMCSVQDARDGAIEALGMALWSRSEQLRPTLDARRTKIELDERARRHALGELVVRRGAVAPPAPARLHATLAEALAQARTGSVQRIDALPVPPATNTVVRNTLTDADWDAFRRDGFLRLGPVFDAVELRALQVRAEALALDAVLQGMDGDELFRAAIEKPLWRDVCAGVYGAHAGVSVLSAKVTNDYVLGEAEHRWHQGAVDAEPLDRDPLISVWIALDPATPGGGGLDVIPGSHRAGRLSATNGVLRDADVADHWPDPTLATLDVRPGEAVLLHNWLVHRASRNLSSSRFRALGVNFLDARTRDLSTGQCFPCLHGPRPAEHDPYVTQLLAQRDASLRASEQAQVQLGHELETASARLREVTLDNEDLRQEKRRLEGAGRQKHEEFLALSARLAELVVHGPHTELDRLRQVVASANAEADRLRDACQVAAAEHDRAVAVANDESERLRASCQAAAAESQALRSAMLQLQSDSAFLAHRLDATYASRSWRITRPLRSAATLMRG